MSKTRKSVPWKGWSKVSPKGSERTRMKKRCGSRCFLAPKTNSFPICAKGTCRESKKGVYAAYVRARQWGKPKSSYKGRSKPTMKRKTYKRVANKAKSILRRRFHTKAGK